MEPEAKVDPPCSYHCSNQMNVHLSYKVNVRGIVLGEDPPRKKKRSQIAGKVESKTNSAPGHDGGINEKSDEEGAEEYDEEDEEELDEQEKDNLDEQDVEEPDKEDEAVGGDGPPLPPPPGPVLVGPPLPTPPVPVLVWDSDFSGGRAFSCTGGVSLGRISIILNKAIGRPKSFSVYCTRHGCQFAKPLDRMPSRDEMLDWFVRGQSLPKERDVWVKERHRGMWPEP